MLSVVILTRDEERHIARAVASVADIADRIFVVDSESSDRTAEIARNLGAKVLVNPFVTQSQQFNWALDQLPSDTKWVFRLDADEIVSDELRAEIAAELPALGPNVDGVTVGRRMAFMGRPILYGGLFPIRILRIFRYGRGRCEDRWMDEHICVPGPVTYLRGEIIDNNLNSLTWWTSKHNSYASREVIDILSLEYGIMRQDSKASRGGQAGAKRWVKERIYGRLPGSARAFVYFFYRYVIRAGFLDGREGFAFHVLQGFWYRFLVDMKLAEVRSCMTREGISPEEAIQRVLGIEIPPFKSAERTTLRDNIV